MNPSPRLAPSLLRLLGLPLAGLLLSGCGSAVAHAPVAPAQVLAAQADRDTASIRVIKREIKKHFEVVTLERIVMVTALGILPAPAWNEFVYEGTMVEDDLETGVYTFRIGGVYDAVSKEVSVKTRDLMAFTPAEPRAPRADGR